MLPTVIIGTLHISTYWTMYVLGGLSMGCLLTRHRDRYSLSVPKALLFTLLLALCGLTGAKLLCFLENGFVWGGVSFFGSVFLIPPLMGLLGLLFGLRPGQSLDACAPCVAVMIAFMRFGCFLNGCCGGWEMVLGDFRFFWPTQAMESVGDFCILALLLRMEVQNAHPGNRYAVFMTAYGILRFFVEFLRDTPKEWLGLGHGQWFAVISCLIGGALLLRERKAEKSSI